MQVLPEGEENLSIYRKYYLLAESKKYSFAEVCSMIRFFDPDKSLERLFKGGLRVKKGIRNTSVISGMIPWMKDKVYLDGLEKIKKSIISKEEMDKLQK